MSNDARANKVAVLAGGWSDEREVSLSSAREVVAALRDAGFDRVDLLDVAADDFIANISGGSYDVAFVAMHGKYGEDGCVQGLLEILHIPYTFSCVLASSLAMQKNVTKTIYRRAGIPVAEDVTIEAGRIPTQQDADDIVARLGLPVFVKPAENGSSFGVTKVKNYDQLAPALRTAFMESSEAMIEGFMDGTEISQGVYKTREKTVVLPATEVVTSNEFFDYDAKYNGQVQEITPARLAPETAQRVAEETSRIYDILHANGIIRIDYIITKDQDGNDKVMMLEINTTPGMTVTSFIPQQVRAAGLDIKDVLTDIVENQF
jgi:D-alanine-D-alanine ligase